MIVQGRPPTGREIDVDAFADITAAAVAGLWWSAGQVLNVEFDADLTAAQQAAVTRRIEARNANEEALFQQAEQAMDANRAYLTLANPDAAAVRQQVERLTRQMNGVIRQLRGLLDGTD